MKHDIRQTIESTYAAAAFAEAGEFDTAAKMAGVTEAAKTVLEKAKKFMESHMMATAFAEAGCQEEAAMFIDGEQAAIRCKSSDTLDAFLENVGLKNVRVCYGWATVEG